MQLPPDTAKGIALHTRGSKFRLADLTNPDINIRYGTWYLRHLLDKYRRRASRTRRVQRGPGRTWTAGAREHDGIQFAETRAYVEQVERLKKIYRRVYGTELGY